MGANEKHAATYHGGEYTPELIELRVAYRLMEADLMMDPNSKPHDPELMAESDAEFDRLITKIRAEAKAEALNEAIDALMAGPEANLNPDGTIRPPHLHRSPRLNHKPRLRVANWLLRRANQYQEDQS